MYEEFSFIIKFAKKIYNLNAKLVNVKSTRIFRITFPALSLENEIHWLDLGWDGTLVTPKSDRGNEILISVVRMDFLKAIKEIDRNIIELIKNTLTGKGLKQYVSEISIVHLDKISRINYKFTDTIQTQRQKDIILEVITNVAGPEGFSVYNDLAGT